MHCLTGAAAANVVRIGHAVRQGPPRPPNVAGRADDGPWGEEHARA